MSEFDRLLEQSLAVGHEPGSTVEGQIVSINEDAVFVDIGGKSEGILEFDEMIQDDILQLHDTLRVGSKITVKVKRIKDGLAYLSKKAVDIDAAWKRLRKDHDEAVLVDIKILEKTKSSYRCEVYGCIEGYIHEKNYLDEKPEIGSFWKANISDFDYRRKRVFFSRYEIIKKERSERSHQLYSRYQEGDIIEGKVEKLVNFGAQIRLEPEVSAWLHISEISWNDIRFPKDVLKVGETIRARVLVVDPNERKITISKKDIEPDPINDIIVGEAYEGKIKSVADFGVFVQIPNGVIGLVHNGELSHKPFSHARELFKVKDKVKVKVLAVNIPDRKVSLSIKAFEHDPWLDVTMKYAMGDVVSVRIEKLLDVGAIVKLDDFFDGFIPISEVSKDRIQHPSERLHEGQETSARIIGIEAAKHKIKLSIRKVIEAASKPRTSSSYRRSDDSPSGNIDEDLKAIKPTAGKTTLGAILPKGLLDKIAKQSSEDIDSEE